ncbi:hypothetical protein PoB_003694100 [Plakobranchus ocellatus]|uniref:Uncharacterized protein n=1 Tax=Plakobranchus ocellatus TaxID=259542 RepID=A0AAV4AGY7_9GAST|nr:hypothetical protein PoB_003694100 [Plakobranchus ocellatus]
MLFAHDAKAGAQNTEEMTALMKTVEARDIDAVRILILARSDYNKKNSKGQTSTDIAMDSGVSGAFEFVKHRKKKIVFL